MDTHFGVLWSSADRIGWAGADQCYEGHSRIIFAATSPPRHQTRVSVDFLDWLHALNHVLS
jgi:hypothetical protein